MKISLLFALAALASALVAFAQAETPATAHRADPRLAAEIQRANLLVKSFPATNPDLAKDRDEIPIWWQSTLDERDSFLAAHVKKGEVINYGTSVSLGAIHIGIAARPVLKVRSDDCRCEID